MLDQDSAKEFFTKKLGLDLLSDMTLGEGGMRWVTVGTQHQPGIALTLMVPGPPTVDAESSKQLKALVAKGVLGGCAFNTDDCQQEYERLSALGVEFVQRPERRPYGVEAVFRDDSGNWYSLTEPFSALDESADWGCAGQPLDG